jgi:TonB family protein
MRAAYLESQGDSGLQLNAPESNVNKFRAVISTGLAIVVTLLMCAALLAAQSRQQFHAPPSAGEAIKVAARAAVEARPRTNNGPIDILTDTQGVDFGPYLQGVFANVRQNWCKFIPDSAKSKKGKLAIAFSVLKDGQLTNMKLVASSGDMSLDRAAWIGITASNPFPALPTDFRGDQIAVRFRFLYNSVGTESTETPSTAPDFITTTLSGTPDLIRHAVLIQEVADSNPPKYPKNALDAKIEGLVRLEGTVGAEGEIKDLKVIEGDKDLAVAAIDAISKWRFHPAKKDGKDIEELARVNVVFRLNGEQVRARVVWPEICCWWK